MTSIAQIGGRSRSALLIVAAAPITVPILNDNGPSRSGGPGINGTSSTSTSMSSKRGAGSDLNRDNWEAQMDNEGPTEMGTWQKADEVQRTLPCSTPPDVPC